MAGNLAILWEQANNRGYSFSYSFNGTYLRVKFHPRSGSRVTSGWSVIIPFHRSTEQLALCVQSWFESDLGTTGDPTITIGALEWLLKACKTFGIEPISLTDFSQFRQLPSLEPMDTERWRAEL